MAKQKDKLTRKQLEDAVVFAVSYLYVDESEIQELRECGYEYEVQKALGTNNVVAALSQLFDEVYKK